MMRIKPIDLLNERIESYRSNLRGELLEPGSAKFEQTLKKYNGLAGTHPALIARCADAADVIGSINFAFESKIPLVVGSGEPGESEFVNINGGLVIDLTLMDRIPFESVPCLCA
jgi:FAD/FMN-containing dehydrogenase